MRRKIDWLNHVLEFLVVLSGILIAFQLEKCSTANSQKETIENHMSYIIEETNFNLKSVSYGVELSKSSLSKLDSVISLIPDDGDLKIIKRLTFDLLEISALYFKKNAFTTLVESGDVRYIKDFETKSKTINLYEYYRWVEGLDKIALATTDII